MAGLELEKIGLDPVSKPGRGLSLDLDPVGSLLAGHAHITLAGLVLDLLADDEIGQDLSRGIAQRDPFAAPFERAGLGIQGVDDAHLFLVFHPIGTNRVLGQEHDGRGGLGKPVAGVGGIVIVRRNNPLIVLELDLKRRSGGRPRIEVDDLQVGAEQGILKIRKERLPLVAEGLVAGGRSRVLTYAAPLRTRATAAKTKVFESSFIVHPRLRARCWHPASRRASSRGFLSFVVTAEIRPAAWGWPPNSRGAAAFRRQAGPESAGAGEESRRPWTARGSRWPGSSVRTRPCSRESW